jgi:tRNA threonylcarbamoyladenosine biosynthesis protein TsaE
MRPSVEIVCTSPARTQTIAAAIAPLLEPGDVVLLDGDLGAGKTTFTQGLARALGVTETVTSPTFTLVRSYRTRGGWELLHVDVYRLERLSEVVDLALPEFLEDGAVAVIEWGQRAAAALPADHLQIRIDMTESDGDRRLTIEGAGPAWGRRFDAIAAAVTTATTPATATPATATPATATPATATPATATPATATQAATAGSRILPA